MGVTVISFSSPRTHLFNHCNSPSTPSLQHPLNIHLHPKHLKCPPLASSTPRAVTGGVAQTVVTPPPSSSRATTQKTDKSGRFCSPRAARELALLIAYASCLEGSDPVRLFDKKMDAKRDPGYVFDKTALLRYDHMSFGGAPLRVGTEEEVEELMLKNERDSENEAEVLSAPPKLVYNRFVLRFTREILGAVVDLWNEHVLVINKVIPPNWKQMQAFYEGSRSTSHNACKFCEFCLFKDEPAARIIELCILHLAMAEITVIGTRHQIVINEAVDLAKRFCDGSAPRIINGCLRNFVKDHSSRDGPQSLEPSKS